MRLVPSLLALATTGALQVNALDATILTFPPGAESATSIAQKQQILSEKEARLVLELRMQSSVASVLGVIDVDTVDHLNQFAKADSTLFGGYGGAQTTGKGILILEGVDHESALALRSSQPNYITVPRVSSQLIDADLLESFRDHRDRGEYCAYNEDAGAASGKAQTAQECLSQNPMLIEQPGLLTTDSLSIIDALEDWTSKDRKDTVLKLSFKNEDDSIAGLRLMETLLSHLTELSSANKREITVVILPPGSPPTRLRHRDAKTSRSTAGQQNKFQRSTQDASLPSTLAPVCHASNSSCVETTNNCSGHGSCYLKFGKGVEGTTGNCYACQCQQSVIKNSDGTTRTVQWGGSACQKKDISSPFFLVAGVSLLAVILVGGAIGSLFSMGSQELPSVISAGVGGPKNQM